MGGSLDDFYSIGLRTAVPTRLGTVPRVAYCCPLPSHRILLQSAPGASGRALLLQ